MRKIYIASVNQVPEDFESQLEKLHSQRRAKVLRCKNIMDKKRAFLAGKLMTEALEELGIQEDMVQLAPFDREKGLVWYANISHSGDYAAFAIADMPIGIDIEHYGARYGGKNQGKNIDILAKKVLRATEYTLYERIRDEKEFDCEYVNEKDYFLKLWTRKEAYAKWDGRGISMDLRIIDALSDKGFLSEKKMLKDGDFLWCSIYQED